MWPQLQKYQRGLLLPSDLLFPAISIHVGEIARSPHVMWPRLKYALLNNGVRQGLGDWSGSRMCGDWTSVYLKPSTTCNIHPETETQTPLSVCWHHKMLYPRSNTESNSAGQIEISLQILAIQEKKNQDKQKSNKDKWNSRPCRAALIPIPDI